MADTAVESPLTSEAVQSLREQVRGRLIDAADEEYEDARRVHNGMFDRRPAAVLQAEQVGDVIAAVGFAREHGLDLSVRCSADVVTAEGKFVTASERENEDLFWGLRGGGGNFGAVTSLEFRLAEVDQVFAGRSSTTSRTPPPSFACSTSSFATLPKSSGAFLDFRSRMSG